MSFIAKNKVRMHDTDMAGRLYFAKQFRYVHDALEDMVESEGLDFHKVFHEEQFVFVIVHCEADFYEQLKVGDPLTVHLSCEHIGQTSFVLFYEIFRNENELVGTAKTVHVSLDTKTGAKIPIPDKLRAVLAKHPRGS